jgi:predicted GNAT family acetyltransferase
VGRAAQGYCGSLVGRRRGYASAGGAALSASVLAQGLRCVLSANVRNLAATSVYQRLGYRAVADVCRYQFGPQRLAEARRAAGHDRPRPV